MGSYLDEKGYKFRGHCIYKDWEITQLPLKNSELKLKMGRGTTRGWTHESWVDSWSITEELGSLDLCSQVCRELTLRVVGGPTSRRSTGRLYNKENLGQDGQLRVVGGPTSRRSP